MDKETLNINPTPENENTTPSPCSTLVELYDELAIENVIGPETFRPKRVIYLCDDSVANDVKIKNTYDRFFKKRGLDVELVFLKGDIYKTERLVKQFEYIYENYEDCCIDVAGGNDAALFAAGMFCRVTNVPALTYSRKKNKFFDIQNAEFADNLCCKLEYSVEDFFLMTGGTMRPGRVDNDILYKYLDKFDGFFRIFLKYRREWVNLITFMTRISQFDKGNESLEVVGSMEQKSDHGKRVRANLNFLADLRELGFISNLRTLDEDRIGFTFTDEVIRGWLRDVGSVLELYVYKACIDAGIFTDVISSAVVDWDGLRGHDTVSNEIDVVAARGVVPMFISCKACEVKTEALNELAILRDRFGGKGSKAVIVTTELCRASARHRAAQLGIAVIDLEELKKMSITERLCIISGVYKNKK